MTRSPCCEGVSLPGPGPLPEPAGADCLQLRTTLMPRWIFWGEGTFLPCVFGDPPELERGRPRAVEVLGLRWTWFSPLGFLCHLPGLGTDWGLMCPLHPDWGLRHLPQVNLPFVRFSPFIFIYDYF